MFKIIYTCASYCACCIYALFYFLSDINIVLQFELFFKMKILLTNEKILLIIFEEN